MSGTGSLLKRQPLRLILKHTLSQVLARYFLVPRGHEARVSVGKDMEDDIGPLAFVGTAIGAGFHLNF